MLKPPQVAEFAPLYPFDVEELIGILENF